MQKQQLPPFLMHHAGQARHQPLPQAILQLYLVCPGLSDNNQSAAPRNPNKLQTQSAHKYIDEPASLPFYSPLCGALAQLVERLHGMQEVRSSTLLCSTSLLQGFGWQAAQLGLTDKVDEERAARGLNPRSQSIRIIAAIRSSLIRRNATEFGIDATPAAMCFYG